MVRFKYEAMDAAGKTQSGHLDAESAKAARASLRAMGLAPVQVEPATAPRGAAAGAMFRRKVFSGAALAVLTRQLAGLVKANLPLEHALASLEENADTHEQAQVLAAIHEDVKAGVEFSVALGSFEREFPPIYRAVVAAGEASGSLGVVLSKLADDLEGQQALRAKVMGAALYPALVTVIATAIVIFLMTYVVPQVAGVYANNKQALPGLTVALLAISDFLRAYGVVLCLLLPAGVGVALAALKRPGPKFRFDTALLRLPILGRLIQGFNTARYASTMGLMCGAGVPILSAMEAAAATLSNSAMQAQAREAMVLVREGAPLHAALKQKSTFPGLLATFARIGEKTGELADMLDRTATQIGTDVQRRATALAALLEPALIVAMGAVVMLIVLAVLMPMIQMNQWMG